MLQDLFPEGHRENSPWLGVCGVSAYIAGSAETALMGNNLDGWKRCPDDLLFTALCSDLLAEGLKLPNQMVMLLVSVLCL